MTVGPTSDAEYEQILGEGGRRAEIYRALRDLRDRYADLIRERFPDIPRRVSGYSLDELLPENDFNVERPLGGAEGRCERKSVGCGKRVSVCVAHRGRGVIIK